MMSRPRVLFVTDNPPHPADNGGAQRTALLIRALQQCADVDLFLVNRRRIRDATVLEPLRREFGLVDAVVPWTRTPSTLAGRARFVAAAHADRYAALLGRLGAAYAPEPVVSEALAARLSSSRYDVVIGRYLRASAFAGVHRFTPTVLDLDDHDVAMYASRLATDADAVTRIEAGRAVRQLQHLVPALLARFSHVWVCNGADVARFDGVPASVVPNVPGAGIPLAAAPAPPRASATVLLVGSLDHPPNRRAVDYFVSRVWPLVLERHPNASLRIVGSGMAGRDASRWQATRQVTAVGYVADLAAEYARAAFAVAPVVDGGGTKIKVLEALQYNRAVVVTPHAHHGYEQVLTPGQALLVGHDGEEFARHCADLLAQPQRAAALAAAGRSAVARHFSFEAVCAAVADTIAGLASSEQGRAVAHA